LHRKLDVPEGRSRRVRKISSPPEFDSRTVTSRYTDCAIRPTYFGEEKIWCFCQRKEANVSRGHFNQGDQPSSISVSILSQGWGNRQV